jgi:NAD-dependent DNA ligase
MLKKINLEDLSKIKPATKDIDAETIHKYNYHKLVKKCIQELQGLSAAIIYDGKVDNNEIELIQKWLLKNNEYLTEYPLSDFKILFKDIMADGMITLEERRRLLEFLESISASPDSNLVVDGIFTENPEITFKRKNFLFTGILIYGERPKVQTRVTELGGFCQKSLTLKTDYLVVGSLGSEDYKYSRFGTKIETAIKYNREKDANIQIIKERDFLSVAINQ